MLINLFGIQFHLFELPLVVLLVFGFFSQMIKNGFTVNVYTKPPLFAYLVGIVLFCSSILLSSLMAANKSIVVKAFAKWSEIFFISLLIFYWVDSIRKLQFIYLLLFLSCFAFPLVTYFSIFTGKMNLMSYRIFSGYEPLFALTLLVPLIKAKNIYSYFFAFLCFIAIVLSLSRGAWLASMPVIFIITNYLWKGKKSILLILIIILIASLIIYEPFQKLLSWRILTALNPGSASNSERFGLIAIALSAFLSSPFIGIGALNFPTFLMQAGKWDIIRTKIAATLTPHNFFVQLLAELGLVGFGAFIIIIISLFSSLYKSRDFYKSSKRYTVYWNGLILFFVVYLIAISLGYVAGHFRFYMALLFGSLLTFSKEFKDYYAG